MDFLQPALSSLVSTIILAMIGAGVLKLFQIATDVHEIRDLLEAVKRNTAEYGSSAVHAAANTDLSNATATEVNALLRAVNAECDDSPFQSEGGPKAVPARDVIAASVPKPRVKE